MYEEEDTSGNNFDLGDSIILFPGNLDVRYRTQDNSRDDRSVILFDDPAYAGGTHAKKPQYVVSKETELMDPYSLIGQARVVDASYAGDTIYPHHLDEMGIEEGERVFLKTKQSYEDDGNGVYLDEDALWKLIEKNPNLFAIDTVVSDDRIMHANRTHRRAQEKDISVLEGCDLKDVSPGKYFMVAVPKDATRKDGGVVKVMLLPIEN